MKALQDRGFELDYGDEIEAEIGRLVRTITRWPKIGDVFLARWLALKLLEGETDIADRVRSLQGGEEVLQEAQSSVSRLLASTPEGIEVAIADRRYAFVGQVVDRVLQKPPDPIITISERIDRLTTHRWLGVPIFMLVMYLVFNLVVNVSAPYLDWVDGVIRGPFTRWFAALLDFATAPVWVKGLILDGVFVGVGGVLVFVPGLVILFFFIGLLEDSGYLARAAVVMDRLMGFVGLRGKSFVPLVLGFGCAVPGIYATRTLENRRDRILTTLLVPLMSCSARMPVYVIVGLAFFGQNADKVIWALYALGIVVAAIMGRIFSRTILKRPSDSIFVMELPPYHRPTIKNLWFQVSQRTGRFIRNAGTVILVASVVIWLLLNLPLGVTDISQSWFGRISASVTPVFIPAGFGEWGIVGSLFSGLIAKEIVISTMSQIYIGEKTTDHYVDPVDFRGDVKEIGVNFGLATIEAGKEMVEVLTPGLTVFESAEEFGETELSATLPQIFTPLVALSLLVFILLYVPCIATLATIKGEFGWKWALFTAIWQTGIAWLLAVVVYQGGRLLGYA